MTKSEKKHRWILDTQMFQRIAKYPENTYEELSKEYDRKLKK